MTDDEQIKTYLRRVQSTLQVRRAERPRVLEEIESHLHEGADEHMRGGATRAQAIAHAIEDLGPPETVAAAFSDEGPPGPPSTGIVRWLPMLVPLFLLTVAAGLIVWSITVYSGSPTRGERTFQLFYVRAGVVFALLSYGARQSIKRADRDRAWRWAAWACAGGALTYVTLWY